MSRPLMQPSIMSEKPAGKRRAGKSVKGATRKSPEKAGASRDFSLWLNRALVLFGATVVVFAGVKTYLWIEAVPVQQITVTGDLAHTQRDVVQEMVNASLNEGGFLHVDMQTMRDQLESLPWIFEASVRRKWPNALQIDVIEQLPIARWGEHGFLNHKGGVFRSDVVLEQGSLPLLRGPEGSAPALMEKYLRLIDILKPIGLSVEQLVLDERGEIEAELKGGMRLVLGDEQFLERMHRFVAVYRKALSPRIAEIARVDLRYETGLAVAYREDSQVAGL
ncbi:MAG: cell division protein FtsQ/DivIB [Halioglobus sp.]